MSPTLAVGEPGRVERLPQREQIVLLHMRQNEVLLMR